MFVAARVRLHEREDATIAPLPTSTLVAARLGGVRDDAREDSRTSRSAEVAQLLDPVRNCPQHQRRVRDNRDGAANVTGAPARGAVFTRAHARSTSATRAIRE